MKCVVASEDEKYVLYNVYDKFDAGGAEVNYGSTVVQGDPWTSPIWRESLILTHLWRRSKFPIPSSMVSERCSLAHPMFLIWKFGSEHRLTSTWERRLLTFPTSKQCQILGLLKSHQSTTCGLVNTTRFGVLRLILRLDLAGGHYCSWCS